MSKVLKVVFVSANLAALANGFTATLSSSAKSLPQTTTLSPLRAVAPEIVDLVSTSVSTVAPLTPLSSDLLPTTATDVVVPSEETLTSLQAILSDNLIVNAILTEENPWQYWFMFPFVTLVAICCQFAGIGGAAVLSPLTLLVFPLLGPEYPLPSAAAAIASALLSEVFGFTSGLAGYCRKGLVDWGVAAQFLLISMPFAFFGAEAASYVASNPQLLRAVYSALMLTLSAYLIFSEPPEQASVDQYDGNVKVRSKTAADGTVFQYTKPPTTVVGGSATSFGAALTGLLGVGIGEVVLPQLVRLGCMPQPVAAGTSVAVVVGTAFTAAAVQFLSLAQDVTTADTTLFQGLVKVIPWNFVQFTVPAALLGGQIAPILAANQVVDDETVENFVAILFGLIGIAFAVKFVVG